MKRREDLVSSLSAERRARYQRLAAVCRDIEGASSDNLLASSDPATDPQCNGLRGARLITCLQPDRYAEVTVVGTQISASQ